MRVRMVDLDLLDARADARALDQDKVMAIASSLGEVGLINPVRVRPVGERFEVVAGMHRVAACRSLGLVEIEAVVVESGDLFAELAMIDENLCRAELGPSDRARQVARRKAIYEELHPEAAHGSPSVSRQVGDLRQRNPEQPRFTADTAAATGTSERTVQREAERGERISPDVLELLAGTPLDTGTYLDGLKRFAPDQQRMLVERDLAALETRKPGGARAIMADRREPDDSLDYFPTPPWATRALLDVVLPVLGWDRQLRTRFWEPACGEGHMSGVLAEVSDDVLASDIATLYGNEGNLPPGWIGAFDFLDANRRPPEPPADWVVTNPPFGDKSLAFALRALSLARVGVALFVRQQWLEGVGRYTDLFGQHPPALIAQFAERVPLQKGSWNPDGDTATSYVWVVWVKGGSMRNGDTRFFWIPPGQRQALTRSDDIERFTAHPVLPPNEIPATTSPVQLPGVNPRETDGAASGGETAQLSTAAEWPLSREACEPILKARYRSEATAVLAAETGVNINTLRWWAAKLGLTSRERLTESARKMNAEKWGNPDA